MTETNRKPLILVTNDDGIKAGGLVALVKVLKEFGDVVIAAPNESYSGMAHAITVKHPLYAKLVKDKKGLKLYKINGTPVDCVKLAINQLLDRKPDLVVSGINHGANSSISLHYSGTMGAAREGALSDIPSVGFSLLNYSYEADFTKAAEIARDVIKNMLAQKLPQGAYLNVNVPDGNEVKGLKTVRQANGRWVEEFIERKDPRGRDYYWLTGSFKNLEPDATDTDEYVLSQGYASLVPCQLDSTAHALISELKSYETSHK
ncbi:5'/3'-nucleotidase SurE [Carboxylicivirga sp. N1Y90]|uniref:5'/3'-nucleotidase SurE n=1 Tax=Carboxylicivirga fragile TaxID=3417571 RepID=UPI003D34E456